MAPIETLRGATPEKIKDEFNNRWEPRGWRPLSHGTDGDPKQPQFLLIYRSPARIQVIVSEPETQSEVVELTGEKIERIRERIKEVFSTGRNVEASLRSSRGLVGEGAADDNIFLLRPPLYNQPISRFFNSLWTRGITTVTDLLRTPPDEYIRGTGKKSRAAIEGIKEILLGD